MRTRYLATLVFSVALAAGCGSNSHPADPPLVPSVLVPQSVSPTPTPLPELYIPGVPIPYQGGPVIEYPRIFLVYWNWTSDPLGEGPFLEKFLSGVTGSSYLKTLTQYYDSGAHVSLTDHAYKGSWNDPSPAPLPPAPPTNSSNLLAEVARASTHFGYDKNSLYIIALPSGYDTGEACTASHDAASNPTTPYIILPYQGSSCENIVNPGSSGVLDDITLLTGHELGEEITDPLWDHGQPAWANGDGEGPQPYWEIGDVCEQLPDAPPYAADVKLSTGTFVVQPLWSTKANGCVFAGP